jgi:hypothetical protein
MAEKWGQDCVRECAGWADGLLAIAGQERTGSALMALGAGGSADALSQLTRTAQRLRDDAHEPLTIGVVGEYSVGKSLLLSALVGIPDLLTVSPIPTTGNITRIRLVQSAGADDPPSAAKWRVRFCSHPEVAGLMRYFHARLKSRSQTLPAPARDALAAAEPGDDWSAFARWCRDMSKTREVELPGVGLLIDEVCRLDESSRTYAHLLGTQGPLSQAAAQEFMSQPAVHPDETGRIEVPDEQRGIVRQVDVTVQVPRRVWPLDGVGELVLVDFPGLSSPSSGERDRYLCRRELADTHTILVVVDSRRGPTDTIKEFEEMLHEPTDDGRDLRSLDVLRKSILLTCARFDQLDVNPDVVRGIVESVTDEQDFLTRREVAPLQSLIAEASSLTTGGVTQPLTLVSAMVALTAAEDAVPGFLNRALKDRINYDARQRQARAGVELWGWVADRLQQRQRESDSPGSAFVSALQAFADDGGLTYLRRQLSAHAIANGGEQRLDAVRRRARQTDKVRQDVVQALEQSSQQVTVPARYQEVTDLLVATKEFLDALHHDLPPDVDQRAADHGISLRDQVMAEAAFQVAEWPYWRRLFDAVDGDQLVTFRRNRRRGQLRAKYLLDVEPAPDAEPATAGSQPEPEPPALAGIPLMSEDFIESFLACSDTLFTFVEGIAMTACADWVADRLADVGEPGPHWEQLLGDEQLAGPEAEDDRELVELLGKFTSVGFLRGRLERSTKAGRPDPEAVSAAYPLVSGHGLPWHPESPRSADPQERHVTNVIRLRRELVAAVTRLALAYLAEAVGHLVAALRDVAEDGLEFVHEAQQPGFFSQAQPGDTETYLAELAARLAALKAPDCALRATTFALPA